MRTFIEDYLYDPAQTIADAHRKSADCSWHNDIDDDVVYAQLSSPEFRLYETMIFAPPA